MAGLQSLASALSPNLTQRTSTVNIVDLIAGDQPTGTVRSFQYFPDTISDTKAINYVTREIPGGSLPIYQWVSSGARMISFTSLFTSDVDLTLDATLQGKLAAIGQANRNVDIKSAVLWLRRYMLPTYGNSASSGVGTPLTYAPWKVILNMPGTGIGLAGGAGNPQGDDSIVCLMTQCDVTWDSFFPSGQPRQATVQLAFAQTPQYQGVVQFPQYGEVGNTIDHALFGDRANYFGYTIQPTNVSNPGSGSGGV